jgi:hypothetical protein
VGEVGDALTLGARDLPVPADVAQAVDGYIDKAHADAEQYSNSSLLDESGAWSLHRLVAAVYARGFSDGCAVEGDRSRRSAARQARAGEAGS